MHFNYSSDESKDESIAKRQILSNWLVHVLRNYANLDEVGVEGGVCFEKYSTFEGA